MTVSIIKYIPVKCDFCGGNAIEFHYSDGKMGATCFGDCYHVINRAKKINKKIYKIFVFLMLFILPIIFFVT